jgi:chromosome segregation ATPase
VAVSVDMPEEEDGNKEPMTNVAERIASAVAKALLHVLSVPLFAETRCNAVSTNTKSALSLPQHVADANGYTSELVRLLQKRDSYKAMASHAGMATKISMFNKARDDADCSSSTTEISVTNKRRNSLFNDHDDILYNRLGETKVQHDSLLSQMDHAEARHHQERQTAEVELQSCHDRKETIALQKADLLRQIQLLQEEETALDEKQANIEKSIGDISTQFQATKEHIDKQLEGPKKVMKLARACRGLEDIMLSFQKSVTDSSTWKVTANGSSGNINTNDADNSVGEFLAAMLNYFQVEAQCVDALKTRSTSMSINLRSIVRCIRFTLFFVFHDSFLLGLCS